MPANLDATSLFSVDGMVAAITGGGTGIGLTMARVLAVNGAKRVYLLGRRLPVLEEAAREHPGVFVPLQCDVTSRDSLQAAVDRVSAEVGYLNLLVANSGISGPGAGFSPGATLSEIRARLFDGAKEGEDVMAGMADVLRVNVTGAFFTLVAFLELLDAGNKRAIAGGKDGEEKVFGAPITSGSKVPSIQSQVIVTASIGAFSRMFMSKPGYAGSKAAILHLTKHASTNLARFGIRANALAPGLFPSELARGLIGNRDPSAERHTDPRFIPARRFGGDEEMAGTILYLASRAGSYCNGSVLLLDGGRSGVMCSSY